ncbi:MAG TPA: alpha/beta fold hydrolase, partial [Anaerolineales bacterium]
MLSDHIFRIPLDHSQPQGEQIEVFAREVASTEHAEDNLPWLVFFQGGPGFSSPRPTGNNGWLKRALEDYRVLLLDQRGTGRSTPLTQQTLARFSNAQAMADYLKHFRADAIVEDAEHIRRELLGEGSPWSVLGQSFGGFCVTTYLSFHPGGLREAMFTGGLPPLERGPDEVYRATYRRVIEKNRQFYERYPEDAGRASEIVKFLLQNRITLPTGDPFTARRFQQLGQGFGASDGFESLHYLLEEAFVAGSGGAEPVYGFLREVEAMQSFDTNPLYAILHEPLYCQGQASRWAAQRVLSEYPQFEISPDRPFLFLGEMIFPWMFDEYRQLQPLKEAAMILADTTGWSRLYKPETLRANTVPCA